MAQLFCYQPQLDEDWFEMHIPSAVAVAAMPSKAVNAAEINFIVQVAQRLDGRARG
jgi:hypothetical protein